MSINIREWISRLLKRPKYEPLPPPPYELGAPEDWPDVLIKAIGDNPFEYLLVLRNGTVIEFVGARLTSRKGWVHLDQPSIVENKNVSVSERGIEIRVADIIAIVDAPRGS